MVGQYCSTCGALNAPFARFCDMCGARLPGTRGVTCARCGQPALPGDRFCDECGTALAPTALLILDDSGWRVTIPDGSEAVIGREDPYSGARPDIDLGPHGAESYGISRRHARLVREAGRYRLEDLGSVNLTYVNDQRLEPGHAVALKDGDHILLGRLRVIFRQIADGG